MKEKKEKKGGKQERGKKSWKGRGRRNKVGIREVRA